jgi:hypothetical protein
MDAERKKYSSVQQSEAYETSTKAPYSVTCLSPVGEVFKISAVEFQRKILKEPRSLRQMNENLDNKLKIRESKISMFSK